MGNQRAEEIFLASGLPDTPKVRRAIRIDASYQMNHIGGRFSDNVESACRFYPKLASPLALAILAEEG
jgi:hypothetical protein